jgi:hypothetical protein
MSVICHPVEERNVVARAVLGPIPEARLRQLDGVIVVAPYDGLSGVALLLLLVGLAPRKVGSPSVMKGAVQAECDRPLGVGRREQRSQRRSPGATPAEDRGALGHGGVHDGAHVVHEQADVRRAEDAVRHAHAALVHVDDAKIA